MSAPDFDHGYLRIPLGVWRVVYCQAPLTRRQLQIVSVVLRESWGWQVGEGQVRLWTRPLTPCHLAQATGLTTDHLAGDLRALIARGVLREAGQRYQLVPEARLWKTPVARATKKRPPAPKPPASTAETALRPLASKTGKIHKRNVPPLPGSDLSPRGDKSPTDEFRTRKSGTSRQHVLGGTERAGMADCLARLIEAFAGPLPPAEASALRAWIGAERVVPVWDRLEPVFRQGRRATRAHLLKHLTRPSLPENEAASTFRGEGEHA